MSLPRIVPQVRTGTLADVPTLVAFNQAMAAETEDKALDPGLLERGVRGLLQRPAAGFYLVAETEGAVRGSLMVTPEWSDWRDGWFWWVQSVYVAPGFRGRGLYRALYEEVACRARAADAVRGLRLYVERENAIARRVYERLGMSETAYRLYETLLS